uniref:Cysteine rich secreted protein n=1 Tax=Riptortus pedestris TaxID=329032 RepID=R4WDH7_RIPPE|nr:cysteine rich secreted protein [Riptortus pedestris]
MWDCRVLAFILLTHGIATSCCIITLREGQTQDELAGEYRVSTPSDIPFRTNCGGTRYCGPGFHCCDSTRCCPNNRHCCWDWRRLTCCRLPLDYPGIN